MFHSYVCLPEGVSFLFVERMWKHGGKVDLRPYLSEEKRDELNLRAWGDLTLPDVLLEEMKTGTKDIYGAQWLWSAL